MKKTRLNFQKIVISGKEILLPIAVFNDEGKKTILITGGIDGDEYSGIKAAYELINKFEKIKSEFRLIVIPLVNIFGNREGVSYNPIDNKFPKYIYHGKEKGSSSEQLIFHLDKFISQSFLWLDLHSGSSNEELSPFIWTWKTKNKEINETVLSLISNFPNDTIIYEKKAIKKVEALAKRNIAYIMLEAGGLGKVEKEDIKKHLDWIKKIISGELQKNNFTFYKKVKFYSSNINGKWTPNVLPGIIVNNLLGVVDDRDVLVDKGLVLYIKKSMMVKKGEELLAVAEEKDFL